jgi:FkbM family methyltransferase
MGLFKPVFMCGKRFLNIITGKELFCRVQIKCVREHHGTEYGGWCICPDNLSKDSVVYSFGVGEDISFDLSIIKKFGVDVYAFDPTPRSISWVKSQSLPPQFKFFDYGIASYDGTANFYPPENPDHVSHTTLFKPETAHNSITVPVNRLGTIINQLGHDEIDILKMDIEGTEYDVINDIINSGINVKQLLIEFHHGNNNVKIEDTRKAIKKLNDYGFRIFSISSSGREISFIKKSSNNL